MGPFFRRPLAVLALLFAAALETSHAFAPLPSNRLTTPSTTTTTLGLFEMFNQGKKLLVKKLAGDFDEPAVRARLDALVEENPVLMLRYEVCDAGAVLCTEKVKCM